MKPSQQNNADLKLLQQAVARANEETAEVFEEWMARLAEHEKETLTDKQRAWAQSIAGVETYENLISSGKAPRGREVPTPAVLQHRPLKPPGSKP